MRLPALWVLLFGGLSLAGTAQAASIAFVGAANESSLRFPGGTDAGKAAYGGGVLVEFRFLPLLTYETGALYLPRKYGITETVSGQSVDATRSGNMYEIPFTLRLHLTRYFSVGAGVYYASMHGELGTTYTLNGVTTSNSSSYGANNLTTSDYGVLASVAIYFPLARFTRLVIDGRYTSSIKDNSTVAGSSAGFKDTQVLVGLRFGW